MSYAISKLASGTIIYGTGQVANRLAVFLLLPVFTRYLSPDDYGIISLLALVTFVVTQIFGLGFGVSLGIVYYRKNDVAYRQSVIWNAFWTLVASGICATFGVLIFADQISTILFNTGRFGDLVVLTTLSAMLGVSLVQPFMMKLQFEQKALRYTLLSITTTLITALFNVIYVVVLHQGVKGWVISNLFGAVFCFMLFVVAVGRSPARFERELTVSLLKLGLPMVPSFIFLLIIQHSGRYMLQLEKGLAEVGIYNIGYTFGMISSLAVSAFTTAWYPYFNSFVNHQDEAKRVFAKIATYYTLTGGLLSVFFFLFARPLVIIFTQPVFYDSHRIIGLITLANIFSGLFSLMLPGIYFAREVKLVNLVQIVCCAIVFTCNYLFIPHFGMIGAALSMAIAFAIMPLLQHVLNKQRGYLSIDYQWGRIILSILFFFVIAMFEIIMRPDSFLVNMLQSVILFILALTGSWFFLERAEQCEIKRWLGMPSS